MIAVIRISGMVDRDSDVQETLYRLRLRRKYATVLLSSTKSNLALLQKVRNQVAYGEINHETLLELIKKRGRPLKKSHKIDAEKIASEIEKGLTDIGIKPFFRLHPPRGGIESKKHFTVGKGVLGNNKSSINDLIRRML